MIPHGEQEMILNNIFKMIIITILRDPRDIDSMMMVMVRSILIKRIKNAPSTLHLKKLIESLSDKILNETIINTLSMKMAIIIMFSIRCMEIVPNFAPAICLAEQVHDLMVNFTLPRICQI